jgi:erythromycin esterase-like protein
VSDAFKDALALLPSTLCAFVAFAFSFILTGALWFNLAAAVAGFAVSMWFLVRNSRRRVAITVISSCCLLAAVVAPSVLDMLSAKPAPAHDELVRKIASLSLPLQSVDAGAGFADLEPLRKVWQGTRLVALGEATHGTSEFFRMKYRITEFLVTQMRFRHFAMELAGEDANAIDHYIQGGPEGNPVRSLSWPWATSEFGAMVDWMRKYNASVAALDRVHFYGIDFQGQRRDFRMARNTLDLMQGAASDGGMILWAHNAHVSSGPGWMGSYLRAALRDQVYLTGFEFQHGAFTSKMAGVRTYQAEPADSRYYASTLQQTGKPILFLDFRMMMEVPDVEAWLQKPSFTHEAEEMYGVMRLNPPWTRVDESWPSLYDGVIYIEQSTPAHRL